MALSELKENCMANCQRLHWGQEVPDWNFVVVGANFMIINKFYQGTFCTVVKKKTDWCTSNRLLCEKLVCNCWYTLSDWMVLQYNGFLRAVVKRKRGHQEFQWHHLINSWKHFERIQQTLGLMHMLHNLMAASFEHFFSFNTLGSFTGKCQALFITMPTKVSASGTTDCAFGWDTGELSTSHS